MRVKHRTMDVERVESEWVRILDPPFRTRTSLISVFLTFFFCLVFCSRPPFHSALAAARGYFPGSLSISLSSGRSDAISASHSRKPAAHFPTGSKCSVLIPMLCSQSVRRVGPSY